MSSLNLHLSEPFLDPMHGLNLGSQFPFLDSNGDLNLESQQPFLDPDSAFNIGNQCLFYDHDDGLSVSGLFLDPYADPLPDQSCNNNPPSSTSPADEHHEDTEVFTDAVLGYISQMLMEEDMDGKLDMYPEPAVIQAAEKPFYDILGEKYPFSSHHPPLYSSSTNSPGSSDDSSGSHGSHNGSSNGDCNGGRIGVVDNGWNNPVSVDYSSHSSFGSSNSIYNSSEGLSNAFLNTFMVPDLSLQSLPAWQFLKGVEEAQKFLPSRDKLVIDLQANGFFANELQNEDTNLIKVKAEEGDREYLFNESRGRKNPHREDLEVNEGRNAKHTAIFTEEDIRSDMFDKVLLCHDDRFGEDGKSIEEVVQIREAAKISQNGHSKGSGSGKGRGKRQPRQEVVDLRTLLIHCAQMVAADDRRSSTELLKQIKQHSSPFGDGSQRLAHYFVDGLEARLAGTGSKNYLSFFSKRRPASDVLRAYQLYLAACPFKRISFFMANMTIRKFAEKATRLHIIDFGIYYGFQWPCFIQRLSKRPGGPPMLRITGIDMPQPGFRPSERIEETGRRLAAYAQSFGVPFEYHAISSNWETVRIEELNLGEDEFLVVNCLSRNQNLLDETVSVDSPRNMFLNTIRRTNPDLFILGVVNGSYNAPFFVTRFREALFYFSTLFDMLETNVPREEPQRLLIERELFGKEALNVIACEGLERVERPETYKQWQVRVLRAGFEQLPLDKVLLGRAIDKVRGSYHKDFIIDEDMRWLLQGWKGRITQALSTWRSPKRH